MRMKLTGLAAILALAVTLTGCAGSSTGGTTPGGSPPTASAASDSPAARPPSETPDASPEPPAPSPSAVPAGLAAISADEYTYQSEYMETHILLPRITGLDGAAGDAINAVFSGLMLELKESSAASEVESKQLADDGYELPAPYMLEVSYSVPYNGNGILCLLVSDWRYLGGAHGGESRVPYIFDISTGRELTLDDLMVQGSGYREYISGVIREEIDRRTASGELPEIATFEDIGDKPWFYPTPTGLVFYFQEYEYFPYAAGIQQFGIPYGDLAEMLKTEYAALAIEPVALEPGENSLPAGGIGRASLDGNATTGYTWKYEISDAAVLELCDQNYVSDAPEGVAGAGGSYTWDFRALQPGTAKIVFTYSRDWETGAQPDKTVEYTVTVK